MSSSLRIPCTLENYELIESDIQKYINWVKENKPELRHLIPEFDDFSPIISYYGKLKKFHMKYMALYGLIDLPYKEILKNYYQVFVYLYMRCQRMMERTDYERYYRLYRILEFSNYTLPMSITTLNFQRQEALKVSIVRIFHTFMKSMKMKTSGGSIQKLIDIVNGDENKFNLSPDIKSRIIENLNSVLLYDSIVEDYKRILIVFNWIGIDKIKSVFPQICNYFECICLEIKKKIEIFHNDFYKKIEISMGKNTFKRPRETPEPTLHGDHSHPGAAAGGGGRVFVSDPFRNTRLRILPPPLASPMAGPMAGPAACPAEPVSAAPAVEPVLAAGPVEPVSAAGPAAGPATCPAASPAEPVSAAGPAEPVLAAGPAAGPAEPVLAAGPAASPAAGPAEPVLAAGPAEPVSAAPAAEPVLEAGPIIEFDEEDEGSISLSEYDYLVKFKKTHGIKDIKKFLDVFKTNSGFT